MKPENYNSHKQKSGIEIGQIAKKIYYGHVRVFRKGVRSSPLDMF